MKSIITKIITGGKEKTFWKNLTKFSGLYTPLPGVWGYIIRATYIKSKGPYFIYYMIWLHSIPMVCIGSEFVLTSQIVFMRDYKYILAFGVFYCLNNFLQTRLWTGRRPYPFMNWDGLDSLVSAAVILLLFTLGYFIISKITHWLSKNNKLKIKTT